MIEGNLVELVVSKVIFYSPNDESAFFDWLKKLNSLSRFEGNGSNLYIYINTQNLDEDELREILSLFNRYNIQMDQLAIFDNAEFAGWFRNKNAYWYKAIFESSAN